jgi:hypothetical protein
MYLGADTDAQRATANIDSLATFSSLTAGPRDMVPHILEIELTSKRWIPAPGMSQDVFEASMKKLRRRAQLEKEDATPDRAHPMSSTVYPPEAAPRRISDPIV